MINSLLYAKLPPHLKRSVNTACLENGTYEEIIQHLERELELNGLEGDNAPAIHDKFDTKHIPKDARTNIRLF